MKVFEKSVGEVNLTKNDFVASGGEGSVYAKGSTAYKIYTDPSKMIHVDKIKELSKISNPKVIRPLNLLLDNKNNPVGYSMRYLSDTHALCQVFTKSFKDRNNISQDIVLKLVRDMQNTVKQIHSSHILIVDLNEMNFLVDDKFSEIYFIDVDSYKTPSFPATAIMESIRDRHAKTFTVDSDWFSFAVVSFQLFMGIHPYKGKSKTTNYSLDERMLRNISVFNSYINIPKICPPLDSIPEVYRKWYFKVFEEGYRGPPPNDLIEKINTTSDVSHIRVVSDVKFMITEINNYSSEIVNYIEGSSDYLVITQNNEVYHGNIRGLIKKGSKLSFTSKNNYIIETTIDNGLLKFKNVTLGTPFTIGNGAISASSTMSYGGRIYAHHGANILEIQFVGNQEMMASPKIVGHVLEKATKIYDGVIIQNLMGSYFASVFPDSGQCFQIELKELKDYKIVEAKFDSKILMVIANKNGFYDKFIFKLSSGYEIIGTRKIDNITILSLNFVCLQNGIVAHINDKENMELFSIGGSDIKEIESDIISSNMKLCKNGNSVYFYKGNTLYSLKTK